MPRTGLSTWSPLLDASRPRVPTQEWVQAMIQSAGIWTRLSPLGNTRTSRITERPTPTRTRERERQEA